MTAHLVARLAVVDDHPVVAEGIRRILEEHAPGVTWVGVATSYAGLLDALREWDPLPDVVLYDLDLRDGSTTEDGIAQLHARGVTVVICTGEFRPIPIRDAVHAGAMGVMLKGDPPERMVDVISSAAAGDFAVSGDVAHLLISDEALTPKLAPREIEVLQLLASGIPRKVIGKRMSPPVAETTVITYFKRAVQKYRDLGRQVETPQDAVRAAVHDGFLRPIE